MPGPLEGIRIVQDTDDVLADLGLDAAAIADLRDRGVVG